MRRFPAIALFGALLLSPLAARAADEDNVAEAKALLAEGLRLFKNGDFEHARLKFAAGRGLVKSDDLLWNLAIAEAKSGHLAEAVNHFREYEREPKARSGDVKEAETRWLPPLLPQVGQLAIDGNAGLRVKVDLQDAGVLPLAGPWAVMPGTHHVEGDGGQVAPRDIAVAAGQTVNVHLGSEGVAAVAPAPVPPPVPVQQAAAPTPGPATVAPDTEEHHGLTTGRKVAIGLGIAAVVVEGVGIGLGAVAKSKDNDASAERGSPSSCYGVTSAACSTLQSDSSAARSDARAANILYIGGGVVAAAAIVTWFVSGPSHEEKTGVRIDPAVGPGFAGLRVGGAF